MSGVPTSVYGVSFVRKTGWPTGGDVYGHGVLIVVVGVTPHRGGRESRPQGEAGQAGELGKSVVEVRRNATVERRYYRPTGGRVTIVQTSSQLESRVP